MQFRHQILVSHSRLCALSASSQHLPHASISYGQPSQYGEVIRT